LVFLFVCAYLDGLSSDHIRLSHVEKQPF